MRKLLVIPILLLLAFTAAAQAVPEQIDLAVGNLAQRLNENITLDDLTSYTFEQQVFADTSLGCPQEGEVYAQVQTEGYIFLLQYAGISYDYRVSSDGSTVVLCSSTPVQAPPVGGGDCPATEAHDLSVSDLAQTTPGLSSNLRDQPNLNGAVLAQIPPEAVFTVTGDVVCEGDFYWWPVNYGGTTGWVAQGDTGLFYIVPVPTPLPTTQPITPDNVANAALLSQIVGNVERTIAWSPDGVVLAVASTNVNDPGVWLYDVTALDVAPRLVSTEATVSAVAFGPEGLLATGTFDGTVQFWNAVSGEFINGFDAHTSAISDMRFNPEGTLLATVSEGQEIGFWGVPS